MIGTLTRALLLAVKNKKEEITGFARLRSSCVGLRLNTAIENNFVCIERIGILLVYFVLLSQNLKLGLSCVNKTELHGS